MNSIYRVSPVPLCTRKLPPGSPSPSSTSRNLSYALTVFVSVYVHSPAHIQGEEVLTPADINAVRSSYKAHLESELAKMPGYVPSTSMLEKQWSGMVWPASAEAVHDPMTGVDENTLKLIGRASVKVPEDFVSWCDSISSTRITGIITGDPQ